MINATWSGFVESFVVHENVDGILCHVVAIVEHAPVSTFHVMQLHMSVQLVVIAGHAIAAREGTVQPGGVAVSAFHMRVQLVPASGLENTNR